MSWSSRKARKFAVVTLVNGERLIVSESVDDVVDRVVDFGRRLRAFPLD